VNTKVRFQTENDNNQNHSNGYVAQSAADRKSHQDSDNNRDPQQAMIINNKETRFM
jgi:hypothetical protein